MFRTLMLAAGLLLSAISQAHFQTLTPNIPLITRDTGGQLQFDLRFTHPMAQGPSMAMAHPVQMGVQAQGEKRSLLDQLLPTQVDGQSAWILNYPVKRPGTYRFFLEPAPYFDTSEDKFIRQHTQVVVDAYAAGHGWEEPLGLTSEIQPLSRPFALWQGSLFSGRVLYKGKPQAHTKIEIEHLNPEGVIVADAFINQVVYSNAQGEFSISLPKAGWWGIAALIDGDEPLAGPDGKMKPVSEDALLWLHAVEMP